MEHYKNLSLESIEGEIWFDIPGWEKLYQVSTLGRVKSLAKPFFGKNGGKNRGMSPDKILKQTLDVKKGKEYVRVTISNNGLEKRWSIHRMVATVFIPNPENKPQVNHIDGNKTNNVPTNLEWCTASENKKHCFRIGLQVPNTTNVKVRGSKHPRTNLHEIDVIKIRELYSLGETISELSKLYPLTSKGAIRHIIKRKSWKHI